MEQNKQQIEIGTMAPIDIKQTEAQVATGEQNLITAEATVYNQEIALRNISAAMVSGVRRCPPFTLFRPPAWKCHKWNP